MQWQLLTSKESKYLKAGDLVMVLMAIFSRVSCLCDNRVLVELSHKHNACLHCLQLSVSKVVKMSKLLEVSISSYYPAYQGMVESVNDGEPYLYRYRYYLTLHMHTSLPGTVCVQICTTISLGLIDWCLYWYCVYSYYSFVFELILMY